MAFWVLLFIGIAIAIGTRIAIGVITSDNEYEDTYYIEARNKHTQIIMNVLVIISIILVGGISNGKFLGIFVNVQKIWIYIVLAIVPAVISYVIVFFGLSLYHFSKIISHIIFIVVFIISIIGWTIPICNYNRNIEEIEITTISSTEERNLLYFCNIPVQEVSGEISGSNFNVSGNISTSDELPYWYINEKNEGKYDSSEATYSTIIFISEEENPHVEIISYSTDIKTINHNNGKEKTKNEKKWKEYIYYLPEEFKQYILKS